MEQRIFSDILIKFFEKEQWAKDFADGKLYINQAGKFITEENNFRGDDCEGCQVTNFQDTQIIRLENVAKGDAVQFPLAPNTLIKQSFERANKVPVFCASGLNKSNFSKVDSNKYKLDSDYVIYMEQFGKYAVLFSRIELLNKMDTTLQTQHVSALSGDVHYKDYDNEVKHFETAQEQYEQFFCKYISDDREYDKQNEWRLILCDTKLIDDENDHYELNIGKLKYATPVINTEMLKGGIFSIHEDEEMTTNEK